MTYHQTLAWMFDRLPMYQKQGTVAFKPKLTNIIEFAKHLDNPHTKFKSIHVAGTNGKGSSSHMLASVLQEAGYKVGLYTSPHLKDFRERIKMNGKEVSEEFVVDFIDKNKAFLEAHSLSFFELTVGMAFYYFSEKKVDIAIIEVGLGGSLDSTNIITPEISLITNIGLDHIEMLGNTLAAIAKEKAGIIKYKTPVVVSEYQQETFPVFKEIAAEKQAPITIASNEETAGYVSDLLGVYQKKNIKGVIAVLKQLKNFEITDAHIKNGLRNTVENTRLLGRWQRLSENPTIICDTAHNKEGLFMTLSQIKEQNFDELHMVIGFVKDKNLDAILPLFPKKAHYYFCASDNLRALPAIALKTKATAFSLKGEVYSSVSNALEAARKIAKTRDFIYVGGSTFVVAEVL